jgi:hypothetical protein
MKFVARRLAWLLPLVLCACAHNPNQQQMQALAPPLADTPPPPPDISPAALPSPAVSVPKTKQPVAIPPEPVKSTPKHKKSTAKGVNAAQANAPSSTPPVQVAEAAPAVEENAMGKFETPEAPDLKKQTENSIAEVERGLNGLGRKLNDQESKTSVQIREFLTEARKALATGDIEGAKTLATKAKTLLGELNQ